MRSNLLPGMFAAAAALAVTCAPMLAPQAIAQESENIVVGTTDTVETLDPAKCYSYFCSNIFLNAGQTLVNYAPGETTLSPELAAEMPEISDDGLTYTFKLREGVTFTDGSKMTAEDVKFSLNRSRWIDHPEGAGFLLGGIESIETPDPHTVKIHLKEPDITFTSKLAYTVATILPSDAYPSPEGPLPEDATVDEKEKFIQESFIGTGPYKVADFRENESLTLVAYDDYWGEKPANDKVLIRFFPKSSQLLVALKSGEIDVAFRHLTPEQRASVKDSEDIKTIEGEGAAIRYIVINPRLEPVDDLNVRKAMAASIDRERIIKNVIAGAGQELYSMVPPPFDAYVPSFKKQYADKKASDFIDEPVELKFWFSRGHYADTEPALAQAIARMLEETGLFKVTLNSAEWAQFTSNATPGKTGQYPAFLLGWYPDYLDPDDYISPFYPSEQSWLQMYDDPKMDELVKQQQTATSPTSDERMQTFAEIQKIAAEKAWIIPLYVITPYAFARKGIEGVSDTMGAAQNFRYSLISKTEE